jgi:hypothetical protein
MGNVGGTNGWGQTDANNAAREGNAAAENAAAQAQALSDYTTNNVTNDLGFTAADYNRALASVPALARVGGGPLGMSPVGDAQRTPGGILSGGPANGWGTLATLAGFAVPGLGPAMTALSIGNMALGAYNSSEIGPNTGELASPGNVFGGLIDKIKGGTETGAATGQQPSTGTAYAQGGGEPTAQSGGRDNQPTREPAILAAITGLPAAVFGGPAVSPYAANRRTPELAQGMLQRGLWGGNGA